MALPIRPRRPLHQEIECLHVQLRRFTISTARQGHNQKLERMTKDHAPYPYGPSQWYKQSNFGLYGGLRIGSGNNVSPEYENKSRRKWRPNIQMKRLYSHALDKWVRTKVATRVLRTIDKCGGLDEYVIGEKPARIKELGISGWHLRARVMQTEWWAKRKLEQRNQWGLSPVRKFYPEVREEGEEGEQYYIGMYGEKIQAVESLGAEPMLQSASHTSTSTSNGDTEPGFEIEEANEDSPESRAEGDKVIAEGRELAPVKFAELGRVEPLPDWKYTSAKHKRRVHIKEGRAKKEAAARRKFARGLKAHDLKAHIAHEAKQLAVTDVKL